MSFFLRLFLLRAASVACAAMLTTGAASASVLFSENFSLAQTNDNGQSYGVGLIDNTGFFVSSGSVDIGGSHNTTFGAAFGCGHNPGGNCIDLIGSAPGSIQTVNSFNLVAGQTYTIAMGATLFGGSFAAAADFNVKLATSTSILFSTNLSVPTFGGLLRSNFTPLVNQAGVFLSLTALPVASGNRGPILDNISLSTVAAIPEPGAFAMFAAGLGLVGLVRRRAARHAARPDAARISPAPPDGPTWARPAPETSSDQLSRASRH